MSVLRRPGSANWYVQFQLNGRTFLRSTKTTDKRAAEKLEVLWRAEAHSESFLGQRSRIKLGVALADYCESKKAAPSHRNCLVHLRILLRELDANSWLDMLSSADLERFKRTRAAAGISPQTIKHSFGVLVGAVKLAKRVGHQVPVLDMPTVKLPRHKLRYLSETEEQRLLGELDPTRDCRHFAILEKRHPLTVQQMQDTYDLVVVLLDTGARYSEIAQIEWRSIDLNGRMVHLWRKKVQNQTTLYMTDRVHEVLRRRYESKSGEHVFTNKKGQARGYAGMAIRKAMNRAGLTDCTIHTLRHTNASRLVQNGMSVYEVRELLGHSDIKTTMRYAHLESKQVAARARDVINALR